MKLIKIVLLVTSLYFNCSLLFSQSSQIPNEVLAWLLEEQDIKIKYRQIINKKDSMILSFEIDMSRKDAIISNLNSNIEEYQSIVKTKDLIIRIHKDQKQEYKKLIKKLKWQRRLGILAVIGVTVLLL